MKILRDHEIAPAVHKLIDGLGSKDSALLVTAYLKLGDHTFRCLQSAVERGATITLLSRSNVEHKPEFDLTRLSRAGINCIEIENLHAKVIVSPRTAIITSMNLHQGSMSNSLEIGVQFWDARSIAEIRHTVESWIPNSTVVPNSVHTRSASQIVLPPAMSPTLRKAPLRPAAFSGYCIRCSEPMHTNADYVLCKSCFGIWAQWGNPNHREKYCHNCRCEANVSYARPNCKKCGPQSILGRLLGWYN